MLPLQKKVLTGQIIFEVSLHKKAENNILYKKFTLFSTAILRCSTVRATCTMFCQTLRLHSLNVSFQLADEKSGGNKQVFISSFLYNLLMISRQQSLTFS
jgi:hypothetical protein